ncbi:hypothetical protein [Lacisediminihabitans changchengi]|uniref:Glutaminase n=1 Tax=Lacisediminihabitans changchengi TaxID=2787634 RepID=A0A934SNJ7_9MICO|nr:hypothetical protein [Lacisediminihabitans changchengi]MBK4348282.1 hypothetical protein [Lacisediminihabitans changchengi]
MSETDAEALAAHLHELLSRTATELAQRGVADEALGVIALGRGIAVFRSADRIRPAGRAWRLGVLLLGSVGALYATGRVTRAIVPLRGVTNRSPEADQRRAERLAASRGGFAEGENVNLGFTPIALDAAALARGSGPLSVRDGVLFVRWAPGDGAHGVSPLEDYLRDRIALLAAPE